jgi:cyclopropane-fatty-acyl-phospholipid synthase
MTEESQRAPRFPAWTVRRRDRAERLREMLETQFSKFPWAILIHDWTGATYAIGGEREHWCGEPLTITIKSDRAGGRLLALDAFRFLESFLEGDVDLDGNLYILSDIAQMGIFPMKVFQGLWMMLKNSAFQNQVRARLNVQSHYDIPQEALDLYLDETYRSYSCAMFESSEILGREDLVRIGTGKDDTFDSLEKAQWRKFQDVVEFIDPAAGDTYLDVGCGYGGQLRVALDAAPFAKVVGWTHSSNQAQLGLASLDGYDHERWELHEGDYREESRVFDHMSSVGMVSHVGPRGLVPYVRQVRKRIRSGGKYVHHALMVAHDSTPHDLQVGLAFNKRYMWPGFHWFTFGTHVRALEQNGFQIQRAVNLSDHYAKTTAAWYERMMANQSKMVELVSEPVFRAKRIFLAGITGGFISKEVHIYRLYCHAV